MKDFGTLGKKNCTQSSFGCETFHKYLAGSRFIVETDHRNLKWLMANHKNSGRLARWVYRLQPYDFEIRYRPGAANANADALSRLPKEKPASGVFALVEPLINIPSREQLLRMQEQDPELIALRIWLKDPDPIKEIPPEVIVAQRVPGKYYLAGDGLLMYEVERKEGSNRVPVLPA